MVVKLERKRYLLVKFWGETPDLGKLIYSLRKQVRVLAGEIFLAKSGLHVIELNDDAAIIRTTHVARDVVEAAIQLIGSETFIAIVKRVSGTIKSLGKHLEDIEEE